MPEQTVNLVNVIVYTEHVTNVDKFDKRKLRVIENSSFKFNIWFQGDRLDDSSCNMMIYVKRMCEAGVRIMQQ